MFVCLFVALAKTPGFFLASHIARSPAYTVSYIRTLPVGYVCVVFVGDSYEGWGRESPFLRGLDNKSFIMDVCLSAAMWCGIYRTISFVCVVRLGGGGGGGGVLVKCFCVLVVASSLFFDLRRSPHFQFQFITDGPHLFF